MIYRLLCFLFLPLYFGFAPSSQIDVAEPKLWELSPSEFFMQPAVKAEFDLTHPDEYLLSISIFQATNQLREEFGSPKLVPDRSLHLAGATHIKEMRKHNFFAHTNRYNKQEQDVFQRIRNQNGQFRMVAENLALLPAFTTPHNRYQYKKKGSRYMFYELNGREMRPHTYESFAKEVVTEWYRSKGHRKNLLNQDLTHIGIAVHIQLFDYQGHELPKVYAVQEFGAM